MSSPLDDRPMWGSFKSVPRTGMDGVIKSEQGRTQGPQSEREDSNLRHPAPKAGGLPLPYAPIVVPVCTGHSVMSATVHHPLRSWQLSSESPGPRVARGQTLTGPGRSRSELKLRMTPQALSPCPSSPTRITLQTTWTRCQPRSPHRSERERQSWSQPARRRSRPRRGSC